MEAILEQLFADRLSLAAVVVWVVLAFLVAVLGGVLGGLMTGGKAIGNDLAAMMGALFGPTAVVPAIFLGLLLLDWMQG